MDSNEKKLLNALFRAALDAAAPATCLPPHLPEPPAGRTVVVGAGKGSAAMAKAVADHWPGALEGLVVTRYGHAVPAGPIEIVEAAHPVPDQAGLDAARRMLDRVAGLGADDLVLCLVSGGGSALLTAPADGLSLADKQALTQALLRSGATITEINCVRKHLSAIKGGRLAAAAAPARVVTLAISDIPGDDPSAIASGPTVADPTTFADARAVLAKYAITEPRAALAILEAAAEETPKPGDPRLANTEVRLVGAPQASLEAAAATAYAAGVTPMILGDAIEGEAREVARVMAGIARQVKARGQPLATPAVLLSGGEVTVTVRGDGRGGPNAEFMLGLAIALEGEEGIHAIACDTDGIDGTEDNAGAMVGPDTLARARATGLDPAAYLANNDGHGFFQALGDLVICGPTLTNVNDFRAIVIT